MDPLLRIVQIFNKSDEHSYIPQECQVHTCKSVAVMYCATMHVFVCQEHAEGFCIPDGHAIESVKVGLEECIRETESTIRGAEHHLARMRETVQQYRERLKALDTPLK
jgi:hypothetical protein